MKDFRKLLILHEEDNQLGFRIYYPIQIGDFEISIQGSKKYYCSPRILTEPTNYSEMEVAIFEGKEWINPIEDERFKDFDGELNWRHGDTLVGEYISISTIQALCDYIEKLESKIKIDTENK